MLDNLLIQVALVICEPIFRSLSIAYDEGHLYIVNKVESSINLIQSLGVSRGGREGALAPPPLAGQNSMLFDFLKENSMLLSIFREIVCHPWKILPSPGKKSEDGHDVIKMS